MKACNLKPTVASDVAFKRKFDKYLSSKSGCYALTTFDEDILYLGLTKNLKRRFNEHLDNPDKVNLTDNGRATRFFYLETEDLELTERTWFNLYLQSEGKLPILNKIYSPVST